MIVDVTPNGVPTAEDAELRTAEDTPLDVTLVARDPENDPLGIWVVAAPSIGLLSGSPPDLVYTPRADVAGEDTLRFQATDGIADSAPATVRVTVTEVNDPPVAEDDARGGEPDEPLAIPASGLLANDSPGPPPEAGQALRVDEVRGGPETHGEVRLEAGGDVVYTPASGFTGRAAFDYVACDDGTTAGASDPRCDTATVAVEVRANLAPSAEAQRIVTPEGDPVEITLAGTDPEGDALAFAVTSPPAHGALTGTAPDLVYTPQAGFSGSDSFAFTVRDARRTSSPATVAIEVVAARPPAAQPDAATVGTGGSVLVDVLGNDAAATNPIDRATLAVVGAPAHGTAEREGEAIRYTADPVRTGEEGFEYRICDVAGLCARARVTITVTEGNHPPGAADDQYVAEVGQPLEVAAPGVLRNDPDPDPGDRLQARLVSGVGAGVLLLRADGSFRYEPGNGFSGVDSFTYRVRDAAGAQSDPAKVTIAVARNGIVVADDAYATTADNPLTVTPDGVLANDRALAPDERLFAYLEQAPARGTVALNKDGSFDYTPDPGVTGQDSFTYTTRTIAGGRSAVAQVVITVGPAGPRPEIAPGSPADGSLVREPVPIKATIRPPNGDTIASWKVWTRNLDGGTPTLLASGDGPPPPTLGVFDPTTRVNGNYQIRIEAQAAGGGVTTATTAVAVTGDMKLGDYTVSYEDLEIRLGDFPFQVIRTYDSTDRRVGDFGVGWRADLSGFRATPNNRLGAGGWTSTVSGGLSAQVQFRTLTPHYVTVTSPDGRVEVFDCVPRSTSPLLPITLPGFVARRGTGTTSMLEDADAPTIQRSGSAMVTFLTGEVYDPRRFRLTQRDGTVLVIDRFDGLQSVTDRNGNTMTIAPEGITSTSTAAEVGISRDGAGRITDIRAPGGIHTSYAYSASGDLERFRAANDAADTFTYDHAHYLLSVTGSAGRRLQTITYGPDGRAQAITDALGNTTRIDADVAARSESTTSPSGRLTTLLQYDDVGNLTSVNKVYAGRSHVTASTFDAEGRMTSTTDPLGRTRSFAYDANGNVLRETLPDGSAWRTEYNALDLPTATIAPDGRPVETMTYDGAGNLATLAAEGIETRFTTDGAGRLTRFTRPNGSTTFAYSSDSKVASLTNPAGETVHYDYDAAGRIRGVTDYAGARTEFGYDALGNVTSITTADGAEQRYAYDEEGRLLSETDPLGAVTRYSYDAAGRVHTVTDREDRTTTYDYDADGNLVRGTLPDGETIEVTVDAEGRRTAIADADSIVESAYDEAGQLRTERTRGAEGVALPDVTLTYEYDANGALTDIHGPSGTTSYSYDQRQRLAEVTDAGGGVFRFGYDIDDRLISLDRPNGVVDTLTYGPFGELSRLESARAGQVVWRTEYEVDALLRRVSATDPDGRRTFAYDRMDRLVSATRSGPGGESTETFAYDRLGNRVSTSAVPGPPASYDRANRLLSDAVFDYTHDREGHLTRRVDRRSGASTTYSWNPQGQLTAVVEPDGTRSTYRYDALGRRIEVVRGGAVTRFVYSGWNVYATFGADNVETAEYTAGLTPNTSLGVLRAAGPLYPLVDGTGSTVGLTDPGGDLVGRSRYSAFGLAEDEGVTDGVAGFAGYQQDAAGLLFAGGRYYDPSLGRFLSEDPVVALNLYPYAENAPTNLVDPLGLAATAERSKFDFHHIVARNHRYVKKSVRKAVEKCLSKGGRLHGLDNFRNLVPIPRYLHARIHTRWYFEMVNAALEGRGCQGIQKDLVMLSEWIFAFI